MNVHNIGDKTHLSYSSLMEVEDYAEAQAVVDYLSDEEFPVENLRIIGLGLKSVENITGRLTTGTAAIRGGIGGAWMGFLIALLFIIFFPVNLWQILLTAMGFGFVGGATLGAIGHAMTGGRRDFTSLRTTTASSYEIQVISGLEERARNVLRLT